MTLLDQHVTTGKVWAQAVGGAAAMAVALGAATGLVDALAVRTGLGGWTASLLAAALCTAIAVGLVRVLIGWPRGRLGLTSGRDGVRAFLLGILVTGLSAALVLGLATVAGLLEWRSADPPVLARYLVLNAVVAVLLEAFPEELTLRGMTWGALRSRYRGVVAALVTTALFLLVSGGSSLVHSAVTAVLGEGPGRIGFAPAGEDPVSYAVLIVVFGLTLVAARTATPSWSLWTGVGAHLTFLTVNRITLYGEDRGAGWSAEQTTPDAILVVPVYLVVAALVFGLVRRVSATESRS